MKKRNVINYWVENLVYPKLITKRPHLIIFLPLIRFLFNTPLLYLFKYFKLDYKLFSIKFDYTNDTLRRIIASVHKTDKIIQAKKIYFLYYKGWRKKVIFSFFNGDKGPTYVGKIAADYIGADRLRHECEILKDLRALDERISEALPKVLWKGSINGSFGVLQPISNAEPLSKNILINKNNLSRLDNICVQVRDWIILLHTKSCLIEKIDDNTTLKKIMSDSLGFYEEGVALNEEERRHIANLFNKEISGMKYFPFVVQHKDFQPGNIFYNKINKKITILDWEYSLKKGLPLIDLLNFLVVSNICVFKNRKRSTKRYSRFLSYLKPAIQETDAASFKYIFYEKNRISNLISKHVDIYCENLKIEKRLRKMLFLFFILQHLSYDKAFLRIFLDRPDNILWRYKDN